MVGKIFYVRLCIILVLVLAVSFASGYIYTTRRLIKNINANDTVNKKQTGINLNTLTADKHNAAVADINNPEFIEKSPLLIKGAELEFKVFYTKCGHLHLLYRILPEAYIGLGRQEITQKFAGWIIDSYAPDRVAFLKAVDGKCPRHLVVTISGGRVVVFYDNEKNEIRQVTSILERNLKAEDRQKLLGGINIDSEEDLQRLLEDFGS